MRQITNNCGAIKLNLNDAQKIVERLERGLLTKDQRKAAVAELKATLHAALARAAAL